MLYKFSSSFLGLNRCFKYCLLCGAWLAMMGCSVLSSSKVDSSLAAPKSFSPKWPGLVLSAANDVNATLVAAAGIETVTLAASTVEASTLNVSGVVTPTLNLTGGLAAKVVALGTLNAATTTLGAGAFAGQQ